MERWILAAALVVVAVVVAQLLARRRTATDVRPRDVPVPSFVDRRDLPRPDAPFAFVHFSSATCEACASVRASAAALESDDVAVVELSWQDHKVTHERYRIDTVPLSVLLDGEGEVLHSWVGPMEPGELWGTVADATG